MDTCWLCAKPSDLPLRTRDGMLLCLGCRITERQTELGRYTDPAQPQTPPRKRPTPARPSTPRARRAGPTADDLRSDDVVDLVTANPGMTREQLAADLAITPKLATRACKIALEDGRLRREFVNGHTAHYYARVAPCVAGQPLEASDRHVSP